MSHPRTPHSRRNDDLIRLQQLTLSLQALMSHKLLPSMRGQRLNKIVVDARHEIVDIEERIGK